MANGMGVRRPGPKLILKETETITDLRASGLAVWARCSRCESDTLVDLDKVEAEKGPLFTFWNKHPLCKVCGEPVSFQAKKAGKSDHGRAWPIHMRDADPGQVAFIDARWRAAKLDGELGSLLSLRLAVEALHFVSQIGVGSDRQWREMIARAVKVLPADRQEDATWLIQHYLERDRDRPGWM